MSSKYPLFWPLRWPHRLLHETLHVAQTLWRATDSLIRHDGIEHAGYLAYLGLLSLFPFLVFLFALAGTIGELEAGLRFVEILVQQLPDRVAVALQPRIQEIVSGPPQGLMTVAIIGAIWTASSTLEGMRTVLNRAYRVRTPPSYPWRRFMSILQFLALTMIVMLTMLAIVLWPLFLAQMQQVVIPEQWPIMKNLQQVLHPSWSYAGYAITGSVLLLVVMTFYYVLPNLKLRLMDILPGALLVVSLWMLAATLFSLYLTRFQQVNIIYGSLGGIIATLLFFFLMNLVFILGAEFNHLLHRKALQRKR